MKVALVYDRINKWGGAERVLLALHKIFPDAPLYTAVYDEKKASWAKVFKVRPSFLQEIALLRSHHEFIPFLMPLAFESFNFDEYDLIISVTSEFAKGIITKSKTRHICICLTPTRYLWSGYREYFKNKYLEIILRPLIKYLKAYDKISSNRPDIIVAISKEVKERIKKYYGIESKVIYPPLTLSDGSRIMNYEKRGDYFLVVSRLSRFANYKRVDLAIKACTKLNQKLKIVGDGNISHFKNKASNIEFLGKVKDEKLVELYQTAKALIFPGYEDFGLVMVEAQSFGLPVIAYKKGGALEIIKEGITGEFFNEQTVDSLMLVIQKFNKKIYNSNDCIKNSKKFSFKIFEEKIKYLIK